MSRNRPSVANLGAVDLNNGWVCGHKFKKQFQ